MKIGLLYILFVYATSSPYVTGTSPRLAAALGHYLFIAHCSREKNGMGEDISKNYVDFLFVVIYTFD